VPEPIYIVGPTASGKSDVAAELAETMGGEIIGADAFQVYRGLDLLTAKPDAATLARVPHHLIGVIPFTEAFDVEQYRRLASERIDQIAARGRVPVVVGGTGLYVRALTHGLAELPPADEALRAELEAAPIAELQSRLRQLDPIAAGEIDLQNPRRVVRAIEVCVLTGRPFSSFREHAEPTRALRGVLLQRERASLRLRIEQRTAKMFQAGVVDEVRAVLEGEEPLSATARQAIGIVEIEALLAGEIDEAQACARITIRTQQYSKRQMTWFRRDSHWEVLEIDEAETPSGIAARVARSLERE
jgi:tRNA dimethylallyltransferase